MGSVSFLPSVGYDLHDVFHYPLNEAEMPPPGASRKRAAGSFGARRRLILISILLCDENMN